LSLAHTSIDYDFGGGSGAAVTLVEAWRPSRATEPWLRVPGLVITALAYVVGSAFVLFWHLRTEEWHAGIGQLAGTSIVVVALVVTAVLAGRRPRRRRSSSGPGLRLTAVVALVLGGAFNVMPQNWAGFAGSVALLVIAGILLDRASRTRRWSATHVAIVGAVPLFLTAATAFTYDPLIGEVTARAKYAHNAAMVAIVLIALLVAILRGQAASVGSLVTDVGDEAPLAR
jgi:hypothetical protein